MPIGKDSITKRVAKQSATEEKIAPELVATVAAAPAKAPKAEAKKSTAKKAPAKKSTTAKTAAKKTAPKKDTVVEKLTPHESAPKNKITVDTAVISNVAPETVEAVIGHKENDATEIVQIGGKMPTHLL